MTTNAVEIMQDDNEMYNNKLYYKLTKLNFLNDLRQYLEGSHDKKALWTRAKITNKIKEIKEIKNISSKTTNHFDVALLNGEEILIRTNTTVQVLPYEDHFDVFIDLHNRFGHLKYIEMLNKLSTEYVIDEKLLGMFMNSCNTCSKTVSHRKSFNEIVHIDIMDMTHKPDNDFHYILLYIEVASNFIIMRPLLKAETNEVASELYKIFIDFGPPLEITSTNSDLLNSVMATLKMTPVKYDMPIYGHEELHKMSGTCLLELQKWLAHSSSNNWAFGCYIIQYILNTRGEHNAKSNVFGKKYDIILNIPYEQSNIDADNHIMSNEQAESDPQDLTETSSYLKSIHDSELHVEEDLKIDLGIIKTENENKDDNIGEKLDYAIIFPNRLAEDPEACGVCRKKGLSELVVCSVCKQQVHLICAERFLLTELDSTQSKVVCSQC